MNLITRPEPTGRRIAAVGMYDGVHAGHRFLLDYLGAEARARGLRPTAVTFSRHPLSVIRPDKAPALLGSLEDRVKALEQAGAQDIVVLSFNEHMRRLSAKEFLRMLRREWGIEALVLGFNNRFGHDTPSTLDEYRATGREAGVEIIPAPEYTGPGGPVSSSAVRGLLARGDVAGAAQLLGHPYTLRGTVSAGRRLGRRLGFPTANLTVADPQRLIPAVGVYAAWVVTPDGKRRPGVVNIGYRPTVEDPSAAPVLSIEAHIIGYTGYIYDEEIGLEFVKRLRGERRFASTGKLAAQVRADISDAAKALAGT